MQAYLITQAQLSSKHIFNTYLTIQRHPWNIAIVLSTPAPTVHGWLTWFPGSWWREVLWDLFHRPPTLQTHNSPNTVFTSTKRQGDKTGYGAWLVYTYDTRLSVCTWRSTNTTTVEECQGKAGLSLADDSWSRLSSNVGKENLEPGDKNYSQVVIVGGIFRLSVKFKGSETAFGISKVTILIRFLNEKYEQTFFIMDLICNTKM